MQMEAKETMVILHVFSVHNDGTRRVLQLEGYVDSDGVFTAEVNAIYVGDSGYVTNVDNAVDIRGDSGGADGIDGQDGATGATGDAGQDGA